MSYPPYNRAFFNQMPRLAILTLALLQLLLLPAGAEQADAEDEVATEDINPSESATGNKLPVVPTNKLPVVPTNKLPGISQLTNKLTEVAKDAIASINTLPENKLPTISSLITVPILKLYRKYKHRIEDAALYPGSLKTGLKINFRDIGDFSDLVQLIKDEGFMGLGLICIKRGAFIVYRKPKFAVNALEDVNVASGDNRCFNPVGIQSMQPLGPVNLPRRDSITFFTEINFASNTLASTVNWLRSFFRKFRKSIKSIIVIGSAQWTITTMKGKRFCLRNKPFDETELAKSPICLLPDLSVTKIGQPGILLKQAVKGCSPDAEVIEITFCRYWGSVPRLEEGRSLLDDDGGDLMPRTGADACQGGEPARALKETLLLFGAVLQNSFDQMTILHWKVLGNNKWKLELLDIIFEIAKTAIDDDVVRDSYMNRIRELYVYHLTKVWGQEAPEVPTEEGVKPSEPAKVKGSRKKRTPQEEEGGAAGNETAPPGSVDSTQFLATLTEYDYRGMLYQTGECLKLTDASLEAATEAAWLAVTNPLSVDELVWRGLVRKPDANIVLEMTWLIFNMVGGLCHKVFNYAHNYWALYVHIVTEMYLEPVRTLWDFQMPDLDILLGGDMKMQYNKLAISTSLSLFAANSLEPFARPLAGEPEPINENPNVPVGPGIVEPSISGGKIKPPVGKGESDFGQDKK